ncbi:hypothetical protein CAMGR0001_2891 [Campylobacter gracilis RM3268]|uniref:Uncharacterized protein n=1 Tax=Campylobacter gracilis RM3268 TaxID=553220 RepID=C8PLA0_9BACT|nr:hypothetical protein CAMGR0001_2891 [Campylobacter gracilis RM3268]
MKISIKSNFSIKINMNDLCFANKVYNLAKAKITVDKNEKVIKFDK